MFPIHHITPITPQVKIISDDTFSPFKTLGSTTSVSAAVRKDTQAAFVQSVHAWVELAFKAFFPINKDGLAWLHAQLFDVMAKHSVEGRFQASGPAWQARERANHASHAGQAGSSRAAAPAGAATEAPRRARKSAISVVPSPPSKETNSAKKVAKNVKAVRAPAHCHECAL